MKTISLAVLLALAALPSACTTPDTSATDTQREGPLAWVTYPGQSGPGQGKHIVFISGDEEYRSEEALPQLGRILAEQHGFTCTVLFAQNPDTPGLIDPNYRHNIPGLEALGDADLMVIFTRYRALPDAQMQHIEDYLLSGRPVIGIRTATHAFNFADTTSAWEHYGNGYKGDKAAWEGGFGRLVLGEQWISHHGWHKHQSTRGLVAPRAAAHPITRGLDDVWGSTDVYGLRLPLPGDAQPVVLGQVLNRKGEYDDADRFFGMRPTDDEVATSNPRREASGNPNDPMMPIAWTKSYQLPGGKPSKAFAATIGASTDLLSEGVRRMYVNAAYWTLGLEVPARAQADLAGSYDPTPYNFHDDAYWAGKQLGADPYLPLNQ
jgi:hypothetical protein